MAAPLAAGRPARAQGQPHELEPLALPVKQDDSVARGYRRDVLVRWGDRVTFDAPRWTPRTPDPDAVAAHSAGTPASPASRCRSSRRPMASPGRSSRCCTRASTRAWPSPAGRTSRRRRRPCRAPRC
ncbi:hypothetical protein ACFQY5_01075 [Paeniroseomonas aquatica]|uniref:hypothetical protein n=1 Tax=Paeniroseomonas aquatica TaxID=373043 RepID=UPI0036074ADA